MKKLLFLLFILLLAVNVNGEKAEDIKLNNFVNDYADVLTSEQENSLTELLKISYDSQIAQIAVVTVKSLEGRDVESFAFEVAEGKLGLEDKDNGLLILIAVEDRAYRFEVGRGLEPYLNDAKVGRIGRDFLVPSFRQGDYFTGLKDAVNEVNLILVGDGSREVVYGGNYDGFSIGLKIFVFLIILSSIVIPLLLLSKSKGKNDKYFFAALLASNMMRGGRGGSGGFGGGFGGFGGGSFGGGGASGGW